MRKNEKPADLPPVFGLGTKVFVLLAYFMEEKEIGKVTHYYGNIGVAVVELSAPLVVGETVHIKGSSADITQQVTSMQIEHQSVEEAKPGQAIGMKVEGKVRENDVVYKVIQ